MAAHNKRRSRMRSLYVVEGADEESGQDITMNVVAKSTEHARAKTMASAAILIAKITPAPVAEQQLRILKHIRTLLCIIAGLLTVVMVVLYLVTMWDHRGMIPMPKGITVGHTNWWY
jgi:hypothetical protein